MEGRTSDFQICVPYTCRSIGGRRDCECVEAVPGAGADCPVVELALRGEDFDRGRMPLRESLSLVPEDHGYVQGVARSPYSALDVDVGLEAVLDFASADIKPAEGFGFGVGNFQIADGFAPSCDNYEWLAFYRDLCHAV